MATVTPLAGVIFTDGTYNFINCGAYSPGTAPTDGTDTTNFIAVVKNVKSTDEMQTTRVSNTTVRNRYHSATLQATFDTFVPSAGPLFARGTVYKITLNTYSTTHAINALYAVCTRAELDFTGPGETTSQSVTLDFNADFGS